MSSKQRRGQKRARGRGIVVREFRAVQEILRLEEKKGDEPEEKGDEPKEDTQGQATPTSAKQHFSPKLAELETSHSYFIVNMVRYLDKCGLCESPVDVQGRCMNPDCSQEWGNPRKLTEEFVCQMIEKAKTGIP